MTLYYRLSSRELIPSLAAPVSCGRRQRPIFSLEEADSLPRSPHAMQNKLQTHNCSRGPNLHSRIYLSPDSLLKKSIAPRGPDSLLEAPTPSGSYFPPPRCSTLKSSLILEVPLTGGLKVVLSSLRRILRSCFAPQDAPSSLRT